VERDMKELFKKGFLIKNGDENWFYGLKRESENNLAFVDCGRQLAKVATNILMFAFVV
jgi:hypothetical protein